MHAGSLHNAELFHRVHDVTFNGLVAVHANDVLRLLPLLVFYLLHVHELLRVRRLLELELLQPLSHIDLLCWLAAFVVLQLGTNLHE